MFFDKGTKADLVVYDNSLNTISYGGLKKWDVNFFFVFLTAMRDKGQLVRKYSFVDVMAISNYRHSYERFLRDLNSFANKVAVSVAKCEDGGRSIWLPFFDLFVIDRDRRIVTVSVNDKFVHLINQLQEKYTSFSLCEFIEVKNLYAKHLYRLLKQYKSTGYLYIEVEKLRNILGVPPDRRSSNFKGSLTNTVRDLREFFPNLQVSYFSDSVTKKFKYVYFSWNCNEEVASFIKMTADNPTLTTASNSKSFDSYLKNLDSKTHAKSFEEFLRFGEPELVARYGD